LSRGDLKAKQRYKFLYLAKAAHADATARLNRLQPELLQLDEAWRESGPQKSGE